MKRLGYLFLSIFIVLASSCGKDGDPGPTGSAGAQGDAGSAGTQGAQGETGTANVIYSDWIRVAEADWQGDPSVFLDAEISAPEITQDIIDKGLVFVYRKFGSRILKLDFTDFNGWNNLVFMGVSTLTITIHKGTAISDVQKRNLDYRYVVVPGGIPAGGRSGVNAQQAIYNELADAGVDVNDYAQVAAYYNIQD